MSARFFALCACVLAFGAHAATGALGTSAVLSHEGDLWIAQAEEAAPATHVVVRRRDSSGAWSTPMRATPAPEPVSADGENRPKIALGPDRELYVSWTSPTSAQYTADIRYTRSLDGGRTWAAPATVHRDRQMIAHRFESMIVDAEGTLWLAWIDKRDVKASQAAGRTYAGAAVYYASSRDRGATWSLERKLSGQSCECCRIALARNGRNPPLAMWRHVFANSERDHALAPLGAGEAPRIRRATFDRWRTPSCPHHGPGLAIDGTGRRHAVWFNQVDGVGRAHYGRLAPKGPASVRMLPQGAVHADVAAAGNLVAVAWKRFDGPWTRVETWLSRDGGRSFAPARTWTTRGLSDQPRLVANDRDILLVWRKADGLVAEEVSYGSG
jgi:hypothetical protein